jgi:prepilin-type N-terminal cleavage/methylation domain-containing protein
MRRAGSSDTDSVRYPSKRRGFTLVELVLSIALVALAAGLFVAAFDRGSAVIQEIQVRQELLQEGRMALTRIVREVRQVRSSQDLLAAEPTRIRFVAVEDSTIEVRWDAARQRIRFLRGGVEETLVAEVDSFRIAYFTDQGTPAVPLVHPDETDVDRVRITLRLKRGPVELWLRSGTGLRNR